LTPHIAARQIAEIIRMSQGHASVPQFLPDITTEAQIRRYYSDHAWDCGYPECESIYFIAEISPDGRVTPVPRLPGLFSPAISTNSPSTTFGNGEKFKTFRKEMQKGLMPVCTRCCGLQGF